MSCRTEHVTKSVWVQVQCGADRAVGLHHGVRPLTEASVLGLQFLLFSETHKRVSVGLCT